MKDYNKLFKGRCQIASTILGDSVPIKYSWNKKTPTVMKITCDEIPFNSSYDLCVSDRYFIYYMINLKYYLGRKKQEKEEQEIPEQPINNNVNHPSHHEQEDIECINVMRDMFSPDEVEAFCKLNAFKYFLRAINKEATQQDIDKAQWYLNELLRC